MEVDFLLYPYPYCYKYHGNCFSCSGVHCIGIAELVANRLFWETYSYE